jgi:hypothetical protein
MSELSYFLEGAFAALSPVEAVAYCNKWLQNNQNALPEQRSTVQCFKNLKEQIQAKDAEIEAKEAETKAKDAVIEAKEAETKAKDAVIEAKDAVIEAK